MPQPRKIKQSVHELQTQIIARQLKTLRKKRGLTQDQLAEKVGLTQAAISSYESGRIRILDVILIDIAKALNISADELLGVKHTKTATKDLSLRLIKRMYVIEAMPEIAKKHILKTLDDSIKANKLA